MLVAASLPGCTEEAFNPVRELKIQYDATTRKAVAFKWRRLYLGMGFRLKAVICLQSKHTKELFQYWSYRPSITYRGPVVYWGWLENREGSCPYSFKTVFSCRNQANSWEPNTDILVPNFWFATPVSRCAHLRCEERYVIAGTWCRGIGFAADLFVKYKGISTQSEREKIWVPKGLKGSKGLFQHLGNFLSSLERFHSCKPDTFFESCKTHKSFL